MEQQERHNKEQASSRDITTERDYFEQVGGNVYTNTTYNIYSVPISTLKAYFSDLSGGQRFFAFSLTLFVIEILLWRWDGSFAQTLMLSCIFPLIIRLTQVAWLPEGYDRPKLRQILSGVVLIAAAGFSFWNEWLWNFVGSRLFHDVPFALPQAFPAMLALGLLLFGFFLIHALLLRDTSAMKTHPMPLEKEFPEKGYKRRLEAFCGVLLDDLNKIDRETNWSAEYFTPLDAEVEMQSGNKRLKKVTDLLTAIRSDRKSKVFLVLGDPGSGKSVALRKLCRDLLKEVDKTDKVPLYINLREWAIDAAWTETNPPTVQQLYDFVLRNLKERGDVFANDFLDRYFKAMFDHGRLFLVLDSFDEIPAVMDTDTSSWLIDRLSEVIYKFLAGAHESRGILASRIFRKPTHNFQTQTTLEIRPFTEAKIIETFQKSLLHESDTLTRLLFKERLEFVPIARNPFTAALLVSYAKEHQNTLPATQAELYADYIVRRLRMCRDRIKKLRLTEDGLIHRATDIAYLMFTTPECGLDVPMATLAQHFEQGALQDELAILTYGRLGRMGAGDEHRFSFAHRRFQEYFVAKRLLENPDGLTLDAIPSDSRWRDALVIYCEVAPEAEARKIAEFCWSEIIQIQENNLTMNDPQYLRAVHSLRFLKDTFHSRQNCLAAFQDKLVDFIDQQFESQNLLVIKLAIEATGLLKDSRMDSIIIKALSLENNWISDTTLKVCRHFSAISFGLEKTLENYMNSINEDTFLKRREELLFSLSISDAFASLYEMVHIRIINIYLEKSHKFSLRLSLLSSFLIFLSYLYYNMGYNIEQYYIFIKLHFNLQNTLGRYLLLFLLAVYLINFAIAYLSSPLQWQLLFPIKLLFKRVQKDFKKEDILSVLNHNLNEDDMLKIISGINEFIKEFIKIIYVSIPIGFVGILMVGYSHNNIVAIIIAHILFCFLGIFILLGMPLYLNEIMVELQLEFKDYKLANQYSQISQWDRETISKYFYQFNTREARLQYIRFLESQNIKPEGVWPEGKIPNINNNAASTLLAQLEERWLGLDR